MISFFKNKKVLILFTSFLISFLFFFILIYNFPIRFQENDDVIMLLLSNGYYTGKFESNLIFMHPLYGYLLNYLYSKSNSFEWYTLLLLGFHFISFILIFFTILNSNFRIVLKFSLFILSLTILGNLLAYLQYTTTSFSLAITGVILLDFKKKFNILLGSFLIFIASLIRFEAAMLILAIYSAYFLLKNRNNLKQEKMYCLFIFSLIFIFFIVHKIPKLYSTIEWQKYYQFSQVYKGIGDNLLADDTKSIYSDVCSKEKYRLLKSFYLDERMVSKEQLNILSHNIREKNSIKIYVLNFINQLEKYKIEILIMLIISLFVFFQIDGFNKINLISIFAFIFLISFMITMNATLKDRVFIGLLMFYIMILCSYFCFLNTKFTYFVSISLILLSFYYGNLLVNKLNDNRIARFYIYPNSKKIVDEISRNNPDSYVSPITSFFKVELEDPFNISNNFKNNKFYFFGWMSLTPYNRIHSNKIKTNKSSRYIITFIPENVQSTYDAIKKRNKDIEIIRLNPSVVYK